MNPNAGTKRMINFVCGRENKNLIKFSKVRIKDETVNQSLNVNKRGIKMVVKDKSFHMSYIYLRNLNKNRMEIER